MPWCEKICGALRPDTMEEMSVKAVSGCDMPDYAPVVDLMSALSLL